MDIEDIEKKELKGHINGGDVSIRRRRVVGRSQIFPREIRDSHEGGGRLSAHTVKISMPLFVSDTNHTEPLGSGGMAGLLEE